MSKHIAKRLTDKTSPAASLPLDHQGNDKYGAYIGLDVHKDTIAISVADRGRGAPHSKGEIANHPNKVRKLVEQLSPDISSVSNNT